MIFHRFDGKSKKSTAKKFKNSIEMELINEDNEE